MEYYYNYASAARKFVVGIAMITLVATYDHGVRVEAYSTCNVTEPDARGSCRFYTDCVNKVTTALLQETPKMNGFLFTKSYPDSVSAGSVTGSASCSQENGQQRCKDCLADAKNFLDRDCEFGVSGSASIEECTMWYGQIN